jgi:hypothetical protein
VLQCCGTLRQRNAKVPAADFGSGIDQKVSRVTIEMIRTFA